MTPEERAKALIDWCCGEGMRRLSEYTGEPRYTYLQPIADAIRAAVLTEREACLEIVRTRGASWEMAAALIRGRPVP